mgnify:CR=1 FL=1
MDFATEACFTHAIPIGFIYDTLEILVAILERLAKNVDVVVYFAVGNLLFIFPKIFVC